MDTPSDTFLPNHVVTQKRMERAVQQAGAANSPNPHEIVKTVIQAQVLNLDQFAEDGQAWTVPDIPGGVDCQSIVRFARKVGKQVGCPGAFQAIKVYATNTAPTVGIEVPIEQWVDPIWHPNTLWVVSLISGGATPGCNAFEAAPPAAP
jgi:hypothetical protein